MSESPPVLTQQQLIDTGLVAFVRDLEAGGVDFRKRRRGEVVIGENRFVFYCAPQVPLTNPDGELLDGAPEALRGAPRYVQLVYLLIVRFREKHGATGILKPHKLKKLYQDEHDTAGDTTTSRATGILIRDYHLIRKNGVYGFLLA